LSQGGREGSAPSAERDVPQNLRKIRVGRVKMKQPYPSGPVGDYCGIDVGPEMRKSTRVQNVQEQECTWVKLARLARRLK